MKMGIQKQDPDYLRAKYAFTRDLIQFHESRGTGLQCDPKINGKELDLYLLYQIVTSHGGWEKINLRNEWDKLLEHFHLPRSTNGGLAIKQIYLRYLELYEKIHYLGEDVDAKEEPEDEYESDFRGRRRFPNKLSSSSHHHHHSSSSSTAHHSHHHHHPKEITDHNRSQLGLSSRLLETSDYDGLLLSLQSPLPNEQDMAISVCTLLSNETKHVLRFSKSPAILNMLLAHAGIYQDCGMRLLMEETYKEWRDMDYAEFWEDVLHHPDTRQLLCECFVKRVNVSLGLTEEDEGVILSQIQELEDGDLSEEEKFSMGTALRLKLARIRESRGSSLDAMSIEEGDCPLANASANVTKEPSVTETEMSDVAAKPEVEQVDWVSCNNDMESSGPCNTMNEAGEEPTKEKVEDPIHSIVVEEDAAVVKVEEARSCCSSCPCQRTELFPTDNEDNVDISIQRPSSKSGTVMVDAAGDGPMTSLPFSLRRTHNTGDKVGQRICQIAHILRNLSFEQDNALVMSKNPTLMRFLLVTANCTFSSLAQTSFDIIGNISSHLKLEEPLRDPLSSMFLTLVTSGVFSTDRFKILRSLEAIRELTKVEGNENILTRYIEQRVYRRMCDLLTLSDIMLLIYTLECILSMTGLGEAVCDEIVRVQGSVATLVSLVTVEAQSYGPKGCILMRVVETVTGATASTSQPSSSAPSPVPSSSSSQTQSAPQQQQAVVAVPSPVVPPTQHLLQQQLQQPPNPIYSPTATAVLPAASLPPRPSPANSPGLKIVTGTTVVPPVVQGQVIVPPISQPHQQPICKITSVTGQVTMPSNVHNNSQMFSVPAIPLSSSSLINHHNSSSSSISAIASPYAPLQTHTASALQMPTAPGSLAPPPPKPSALPSSSISEIPSIKIQNNCKNGSSVPPTGVASHSLPPGATAVVIQQQNASANPTICPPGNGQPVAAAAVNGVPSLVTATLPQISNHSLSQQHRVVTPTINLVTPKGTLSEEAWSIAWLKGSFESASGTSIEQGEMYRMYCAARKNPSVVLNAAQFVECVMCAYGAGVGPVIKDLGGGVSLPFLEGIKPKIRAVAAAQLQAAALKAMGGAGGANAVVTAVTSATTIPTNPQLPQQIPVSSGAPTLATTPIAQTPAPPSPAALPPTVNVSQVEGETSTYLDTNVNNNNDNGTVDGATHPVSVNIPSRDVKPSLSPILQATLSQPPKAKNNNNRSNSPTATPPSRAKNQKRKETKQINKQKKESLATTSSSTVLSQKFSVSSSASKGNSAFSPASSAIRSLLASKVAQRQQNKLHQQLPKNTKVNDKGNLPYNAVSKEDNLAYPSSEVVKVNGIGPDGSLDKIEESSASSSLLSSDGSDNSTVNKSAVPITSFHGVLHNGQANLDVKNEFSLEGELEVGGKNRAHMKGMLIDLLERRVPSREPVNGVATGREIRISEKGLELIEKMEESLAAGSSEPTTVVNHSNSTCPSSDVQESQKMTFYSSTSDAQVTLQGQASNAACVIPVSAGGTGLSGSAVTIVSSGGGAGTVTTTNSTLALRTGGQQVKLCSGKIIRVIEHSALPLCTSTVTALATSTAIAEVQSTTVPTVSTATAFCHGDELFTSCADSAVTPANGEVTYVIDDSGQSTMIVDVVESVITNANSVTLDSGSNGDGQNVIIADGDGDSAASCSDTHKDNGAAYNAEMNCNNGSGGAGGDLLEKFSQFSDLIVVPPEQLASLKRPSSPLPEPGTTSVVAANNNNNSTGDDLPPPTKKQAMDVEALEAEQVNQNNQAGLTATSTVPPLTDSGNDAQNSTATNIPNNTTPVTAVSATAGTTTPTTAPSLPPGAGAQVVQLPLRLSVNPQNPQQLTFTRQLVLPSGQQLLLSTGNTQSAIQGQVLISKPQGSATDQIAKAIIILQQPQQQKSAATSQPVTTSQNLPVASTTQQQIQTTSATTVTAPLQTTTMVTPTTSVLQVPSRPTVIPSGNFKPQIVTLQQHQYVQQQAPAAAGSNSSTLQIQKVQSQQTPIVHQVIAGSMHHPATVQSSMVVQQQQSVSQTATLQHQLPHHHTGLTHQTAHGLMMKPTNYGQFEGVRSSSYPHLTSDQLDLEYPFLCEWAGCGLRFLRPQQVSMHALKAHCPEALVDAVRCEWGQNGCDPLLRKRFSLMTHLQDRHCSKQALEMALYRRKNKIEPPPIPQQPLHHPGYAPNAAFHAIKRHAMSFMSTKEHLHDDNEGPVTKSIRLTAALILRNLVNYSGLGRRMLHGYESHLSSIAMSNVESSRTIAQLLHDMNDQPKSSK